MTKEALNKIAEFVQFAVREISSLQTQLNEHQTKRASELVEQDREFDALLRKAAEAMYNSDFINDEEEKTNFIKKAKEDAKYLAKIVERVCVASDVAYMGKSSSVKASNYTDDPVIRRAFGYGNSYDLLDE